MATNAERQAAHKARRVAAGWRKRSVWVLPEDYRAGGAAFDHGAQASDCPVSADARSWLLGFADAQADFFEDFAE